MPVLALLTLPLAANATTLTEQRPIAVVRALDKITARVEELEIPIGQPLKFGTIAITVHDCRVTPPEETPEAAAFIDVAEFKPGEQGTSVFHGWMFASSPALSALEDPVYDLWVTGCKALPAPTTPIQPQNLPAVPAPPPANAGSSHG